MDNNCKNKHNYMLKIDRYERAIIELSNWNIGNEISNSTKMLTGEISSIEVRDAYIEVLKKVCSEMNYEKKTNIEKLYLTDIVRKENPIFSNNNLIIAPTGSGKSHFIKSLIKEKEVLFLVSTTSLKDKLVPESEATRMEMGNRMYSTKRTTVYGDNKEHKILVMTYAEFGNKMKFTDKFANKYKQIFCDEIHSLFNYYKISNTDTLLVAIRYLFESKENQEKFYFTATNEHLLDIEKESADLFSTVAVFDYTEHEDIIKNVVISSYKINHIEQVRPHLKAKLSGFKYFGYKVFAFSRSIKSQIYLEKLMKEEGYEPLVLWSINNEDYEMSKEQLKQREYVLRTGLIPEGYNALIINSSMQEGWDLLDPKVKLVVMNTTNTTELIQAQGRVRGDIDVLVYKAESSDSDNFVDFPVELIGEPLTVEMKDKFSEDLNFKNSRGRLLKWTSIASILEKQGFRITNKSTFIDGKRHRVSIVNYSI